MMLFQKSRLVELTDEIRKYIKFQIEIDLSQPIVPGWTLDQGTAPPVWIDFKYEKLPNLCFGCGKFSHETGLCPLKTVDYPPSTHHIMFGPWLRAKHIAVERLARLRASPSRSSGDSYTKFGQLPFDPNSEALKRHIPTEPMVVSDFSGTVISPGAVSYFPSEISFFKEQNDGVIPQSLLDIDKGKGIELAQTIPLQPSKLDTQ